MMQAEHYRDAFHTYLVLPEPEEAQKGGYQYRMLTSNRIPGLLPCSARTVDGAGKLCYDITARQKFSVFYAGRGIDTAGLRRLAEDLTALRKQLSAHLLDPAHLVVEGEYVYYDLSGEHFLFLYYPDGGGRNLKAFFEETADLVREEDREAARLAFRLVSCGEDEEVLFHMLEAETAGNCNSGATENEEEGNPFDRIPGGRETDRQEPPVEGSHGEADSIAFPQDAEKGYRISPHNAPEPVQVREERRAHRLSLASALSLLGSVGAAAYPMFFPVTERELLLCRCLAVFFILSAVAGGILLLIHARNVKRRREAAAGIPAGPDLRLFREEMLREQVMTGKRKEESRRRMENRDAEFSGNPGGTVFLGFEQDQVSGLYGMDPDTPNIDLRRLPLTVGRTGGYSDRVIENEGVSRMHVRFSRGEQGEILMRDLNSTNGTWLNGNLLEPEACVRVHRGDEIRIGDALYQCR